MTRSILLTVLICVAMTSCEVVAFENPIPEDAKAVDIIPERFWGNYDFSGANTNISQLEIAPHHMRVDGKTWHISDSMRVKKMGQELVVNLKFRDKPVVRDYWVALVLSPPRSGQLKVYRFGSGLRPDDVVDGKPPRLTASYGARELPTENSKTEPVVFVMRANEEKLKTMLKDEEITLALTGIRIKEER